MWLPSIGQGNVLQYPFSNSIELFSNCFWYKNWNTEGFQNTVDKNFFYRSCKKFSKKWALKFSLDKTFPLKLHWRFFVILHGLVGIFFPFKLLRSLKPFTCKEIFTPILATSPCCLLATWMGLGLLYILSHFDRPVLMTWQMYGICKHQTPMLWTVVCTKVRQTSDYNGRLGTYSVIQSGPCSPCRRKELWVC